MSILRTIVHRYLNAPLLIAYGVFNNLPKKRDQALTALREREILTVSDAPDFLKQRGIIRFSTKNNKIQFEVNLKAANLGISSKLLRLAEIYGDKK